MRSRGLPEQPEFDRVADGVAEQCPLARDGARRGAGLVQPQRQLFQGMASHPRVFQVARRAALFGLSNGGRAAIAFAAAHPERNLGLIRYGSSYRGPRAPMLRTYRSTLRHSA